MPAHLPSIRPELIYGPQTREQPQTISGLSSQLRAQELLPAQGQLPAQEELSAQKDLPAWVGPAVGLLDLDAFFASVEVLDHPEWAGKPLIVGGDADRRGVVSTASYEARAYGVRSAMPSAQAARLCPDAIWTPGNYARYREVSRAVMQAIVQETPYMEQVSIDEAFFEVSPGRFSREHPLTIVRRICAAVASLGVTCSVGLAVNKTTAKIASERNKPRGITAVYPGYERAFLAPLPVRAMSGIGKATQAQLARMGILTLADLAAADPTALERVLGVSGPRLVQRAAGLERSAVASADKPREVKSVSSERTFAQDLRHSTEVMAAVSYIAGLVARRLRHKKLAGKTVTVKLTSSWGHQHTASKTLDYATATEADIRDIATDLVRQIWSEGQPVRLLGIGLSGFEGAAPRQLTLFDALEDELPEQPHITHGSARRHARDERLAQAGDLLRQKFGDGACMRGNELRFKERTSNTAPMHKEDG